jgi:heat shock protein HslJ
VISHQIQGVAFLLPAIIGAVLSFGCAKPDSDTWPLRGTQWQLVEMGDSKADNKQLHRANITFTIDDNRVSGSDGCNRFFGAYYTENDELRFEKMGTTRMACPDERTFDVPFYFGLSATTHYSINEDRLRLFNDKGTTLLFQVSGTAEQD